jgi:hypothetical protein
METVSAIYRQRLNLLLAQAQKMAERRKSPPAAFERQTTIVELFTRLRDFADKHFSYFEQRIDKPGTRPVLKSDAHYPLESAFFAIVAQVARDLDVLMQATYQRQHGDLQMLATLRKADRLAYAALQPARQNYLRGDEKVERQTVLAYFQKERSIRVIPYAPVALVGIPLTCIAQPKDFYAIPHEIGHYVFWHGNKKSARKPLREEIRKVATPWTEELFADVYGAIIAGKGIAEDFRDLAFEYAHTKFYHDDHKHPPPAVRPYIYFEALRRTDRVAEANELEEDWERRLTKKATAEKMETLAQKKATLPTKEYIQCITRSMLDQLNPIEQPNPPWSPELPVESIQIPELNSDQAVKYPDCINDNAITGEEIPSPGNETDDEVPTERWRRWVFAVGWTDGPNGGYNP